MYKLKILLFLAFVISFFSIGFPYWQIPYVKIALPNALLGWNVLIPIIAGLLLRLDSRCTVGEVIVACGAAFPAVVLARIIYEVAKDPGSHNLWPFELLIATVVGLIVIAPAAAVGGYFQAVDDQDKDG